MGVAIGLALGGRRPFVDLMFCDFVTAASDQLFNHAAKIRFMSGGTYSVPLTVWTIAGAGTRWGAQHSQRLDGWLAQVPGLKMLAPATPAAAASAVAAAIADPDPVVLLADRSLLYSRTPLPNDGESPWRSRVVQHGTEVTVAATGRLVHVALEAGRATGCSVEVVDLQRLAPLDVDPLVDSATRTGKVLVLHEEASPGAMAGLIAAAVYDAAFWTLDAPIVQLTGPPTPVPAAPRLEDAYLLDVDDVSNAIKQLVRT
jgi:pyruvate dehydrogenase E1 component beta subunit